MTALSAKAASQVAALAAYYEAKGRTQAATNLASALKQAAARIDQSPDSGLPAPRPYPALARSGRSWIKQGPYWIVYTQAPDPVILGIYHEAANIPRRL